MSSTNHHQILALLRRGCGLNIVGDVHVDAAGPADLTAWLEELDDPTAIAWRSTVTGRRHLQIDADRGRNPIRGHLTVLFDADRHRRLWDTLLGRDLGCGDEQPLDPTHLRHVLTTPHPAPTEPSPRTSRPGPPRGVDHEQRARLANGA